LVPGRIYVVRAVAGDDSWVSVDDAVTGRRIPYEYDPSLFERDQPSLSVGEFIYAVRTNDAAGAALVYGRKYRIRDLARDATWVSVDDTVTGREIPYRYDPRRFTSVPVGQDDAGAASDANAEETTTPDSAPPHAFRFGRLVAARRNVDPTNGVTAGRVFVVTGAVGNRITLADPYGHVFPINLDYAMEDFLLLVS
jgi:hypothetical protein